MGVPPPQCSCVTRRRGEIRGAEKIDLLLQIAVILIDAVAVAGDKHRAAAEVTERIAEGEMEIEREVAIRFRPVRLVDLPEEVIGGEGRTKKRCGRVARIARPGPVVLLKKRYVDV